MQRLFGFVMILGIAFSFIACKASAKNDNDEPVVTEDSNTKRYANEYLEIIVIKGVERAAYYAASEIDHFNLVVDFEDSSIEDLNVNFDPNDTYSFNIFKDCTVLLKVSGFDSSSNRIAYGSKNVSFTVGNDVSVTVAVDMFTKSSTITVGVQINEPNGGQTTENKWFKYDGNVPNIPLGLTDDSENDTQTGKLENAELYLYYNRDDGLTVAIQAESEQVIELFGGAASTTMKLVTGNVNTYENFTVARWITLSELAAMSPCEAPEVVTEPDKCILIGGEESNNIKIQWKKVRAKIIINKL